MAFIGLFIVIIKWRRELLMIPDNHALMLFKFGEYKWIKQIQDGFISFACPGRYIDSAKRTGNNEQGDIDEGIFARLKKMIHVLLNGVRNYVVI